MEEELTERLKELRTDKTRRYEEELAHCQRGMEQLTEHSREADDKTTHARTNWTGLTTIGYSAWMNFMYKPVQQKDAIIQQKVEAFHELTEDVCPKD